MTKKKFDTFNTDDIETLRNIAKDQGSISIHECEIQDPNNPAKMIEAVVVSLNR